MLGLASVVRFRGKAIFAIPLLLVLLFTTGCKENPAHWPAEKVAEIVAKKLEVSDLTLQPTDSGFEGSGLRSDGETVNVVVTLHPDDFEFRWDGKGDRGFIYEGSYGL